MSLKNFHLLFIALSVLLALFVGAWAFRGFQESGSPALAAASVASIAGAGLLLDYERRFARRCRKAGL